MGVSRVLCAAPAAAEAALAGVEVIPVDPSRAGSLVPEGRRAGCATAAGRHRGRRTARPAGSRRGSWAGARSTGARDRGDRRSQPPAGRAAGHGKVDARAKAAEHPAAVDDGAGARGHADPLDRRDGSAAVDASAGAAVPRAASRCVGRGRDRRWRDPAPGRGEPRASRRSPPRRDAGVSPARARGAPAAARGRRRLCGSHGGPGDVSGEIPACRDDESLPVRCARRSHASTVRARPPGSLRIGIASRGRCSTGSISRSRCRDRGPRSCPARPASRRLLVRRRVEDGVARLAVLEPERVPAASELLDRAVERLPLSGRGRARVARVSRTIAALAGADVVQPEHVAEALSYRTPRDAIR